MLSGCQNTAELAVAFALKVQCQSKCVNPTQFFFIKTIFQRQVRHERTFYPPQSRHVTLETPTNSKSIGVGECSPSSVTH